NPTAPICRRCFIENSTRATVGDGDSDAATTEGGRPRLPAAPLIDSREGQSHAHACRLPRLAWCAARRVFERRAGRAPSCCGHWERNQADRKRGSLGGCTTAVHARRDACEMSVSFVTNVLVDDTAASPWEKIV